MSLVTRQNNLFASEDWKVAYKAYSEINFKAYDFDTIKTALVEYVRINYPENFNDYVESSEFIAIIELLAYLSQSLAFRMDLNSRENFLETAERRDSVFKLARMLGYNPKRNVPASGLMKIVAVRTTEPLVDSQGNDLNNINVFWDDSNNVQSYEQFITILNAAMSSSNRFSAPVKRGTVGGIPTELYQLNTPLSAPIVYNFNLTVNGGPKTFNVVNPEFFDNGYFYERHPDPTDLFNLIYRNDSLGLASKNTGFFIMFKQGVLQFSDYNYTTPIQNRSENVAISNINETDVFLQEINSAGVVLNKWEKVPNTVGQTLNYNSLTLGTKNLYAVENLNNGGIRLRFPDGNFGNIPYGIFRLWYRTSDPTRYTIQPEDARNITVTIPYENKRGQSHALTITFRLETRVNNSLPAESLSAIKERAPQVYYSQNRMISAQDYNTFPLSQSTNITKLKAINRTHAGHSRYIDINDPTGTYQSLDTFARDAILYTEDAPTSERVTVNDNTTPREIAVSIIPQYLKKQPLNNFVYKNARNTIGGDRFRLDLYNIRWNPLPVAPTSDTGFMTETYSDSGAKNVLTNVYTLYSFLKENNFIKFVNPSNPSDYKWVRIISVVNNGLLASGMSTSVGPWQLSDEVPLDWVAEEVIVSLRKLFNSQEATNISSAISNRETFGLGYDLLLDNWYIIESQDLNKTGDFAFDPQNPNAEGASWLVLLEYSPVDNFSYRYNITFRGQNYVVQSRSDLKFYNIKNVKVVDNNNRSSKDTITFTTINTKPSETETFEWYRIGSSDYFWRNTSTGGLHDPNGYTTNISLKTRDTKWFNVNVFWESNFGLMKPSASGRVQTVTDNSYVVSNASVMLNTYFDDGTGASITSNVTIANNSGQITRIPGTIKIPFTAETFGGNILDSTGNITYRQFDSLGTTLLIFHGNTTCYSYGTTGSTLDANVSGRMYLEDANVQSQTGNLVYTELNLNRYHLSADATGKFYRDKIVVNYINTREKLEQPVVWDVVDVYKYSDGYTDPRKVIVAPIDSDSDLVPNRPLQFNEYVDDEDIQLFEYYTDFDGYTYDRPVQAAVVDFRSENTIRVNFTDDVISSESYAKEYALSSVDWLIAKNFSAAQVLENTQGYENSTGIKVYCIEEDKVYITTPDSTDIDVVTLVETDQFFVRTGRGPTQDTLSPVQEDSVIRWQHAAPKDVRIDPSISNIVEMVVLTTSYYNEVLAYLKQPSATLFPLEPTSDELAVEFQGLNEYKSASDTIVFRSAKFKLLFGDYADSENQAKFRVVKLSNNMSDNELKAKIIQAINNYFNVTNWEFGETFYFTELSSYIHQQLGSAIGSIVIVPKNTSGRFGDLFQVKAEPNELFASTATVNDIEIVEKISSQTLRPDR